MLRRVINIAGFGRVWSRPRSAGVPQHLIAVSEEVRHAVKERLPVVALESTIITHGMPYPKNVECALGCERKIRDAGAVPATVAILDGRLTIGLSRKEIEAIGDVEATPSVKTSRRDLAYVMGHRLNGGTTVSGTLIAADIAGIAIFATGGIGGVHRLGEKTMDVSADLVELGRTPVAVVSSGVKSILDIPKTLEYLETRGVFVSTYGPTKAFPAFYTADSGCQAPYNVSTPLDAAKVVKSCRDLQLRSGMLFAVPVPENYALPSSEINSAIEKALEEAEEKGIRGKEITPFLLGKILEVTGGKSLETNIALVQNNARVAGEIAAALSGIERAPLNDTPKSDHRPLVIIGASILDRCATTTSKNIQVSVLNEQF